MLWSLFLYNKNCISFYKKASGRMPLARIIILISNKSQEKSKNISMEFLSDNVKIIVSVSRKETGLYVQNHTDR